MDKARWDEEAVKLLLNLCIEQIHLGNRQGKSFTEAAWQKIVATFQETSGRCYDKKQLKNKYELMRRELRAWIELNQERGLGWNLVLNTVTAPKAWWKKAAKKNKLYARFKEKGLQFESELSFIFKDDLKGAHFEFQLSPGLLRHTMEEVGGAEDDMVELSGDSEDDQIGDFVEVDNGELLETDDSEDEMLSLDDGTTSSNDMLKFRDQITQQIVRDMQHRQHK